MGYSCATISNARNGCFDEAVLQQRYPVGVERDRRDEDTVHAAKNVIEQYAPTKSHPVGVRQMTMTYEDLYYTYREVQVEVCPLPLWFYAIMMVPFPSIC